MLVLTRKIDEGVIIDGEIVLKILAVEDGKVKLGIEAPRNIEIHRQEVYDQIRMENQEATLVSTAVLENLKIK